MRIRPLLKICKINKTNHIEKWCRLKGIESSDGSKKTSNVKVLN